MKFTKMHGIGNDYVYVNCFEETVENPAELAIRISDRHFGIGSDGLILICPSEVADARMEMYNADGSRGRMCGNGIRCVAKYVYDRGLADKTEIKIETDSGIKQLELTVETENGAAPTPENRGRVKLVKVDMGAPILTPQDIPVKLPTAVEPATEPTAAEPATEPTAAEPAIEPTAAIIGAPIEICGKTYAMTCVSMGNPHCIIPVEDVDSLDIEKIGPHVEHHPYFPERINTEFIRIIDRGTVQMRVWERGSGETLACGTGACAVAVACILNGWTEDEVRVKLIGGDLLIRWDKEKNTVFMTGEATIVFDGEIEG